MPNTFTQISETTLSAAASNLVLSSIPGTYTDLVVRIKCLTSYTGFLDIYMWANNDNTGIYCSQRVSNDGSGFTVNRSSNQGSAPIAAAAGTNLNSADFNNVEIYLANYANTSYAKTALGTSSTGGGSASGTTQTIAWLRNSSAAITTLNFGLGAGQFNSGTLISLYGIKNT